MITEYCQRDVRWASVAYAGETMGIAGCGPTSCACLTGELPTVVAEWMTKHGYASNQSGTYQSAIPAYLKSKGYDAQKITSSSLAGKTESLLFDPFRKSIEAGNCGIILFGGKKTGCKDNYWCSGGHYCAVVGYANGKYRVIDPYTPSHNGYHDWSDIAGDVKHLYTTSVRWKAEEETADMDYLEGVEIDTTFVPGIRYASRQIKAYSQPNTKATQRKSIPLFGRGNEIYVALKTKDNWGFGWASGDPKLSCWFLCSNLSKKNPCK